MLDLQLMRVARPAVDLSYLFGSSTSPEFRKEHLADFLQFYHTALASHLGDLGHRVDDLLTLDQLKRDFDECFVFGFVVGILHSQVGPLSPF